MQSKVKDVLFKLTTVVICGLAYCMCNRAENPSVRTRCCYEPGKDWYGLAAKTISRSSMWSSDKADALRILLSNGPDSYYQSVISIVNSNMWSSDKLSALKKESAKFADLIQI